ncbi:MAG: helix-turn-helix domain-containing protein [Miltoncostaeaceae bacterium]
MSEAVAETGTPQLLSVSAASRMLGVSPSSLRAWAAAGEVPHVRTQGGHRRFDMDELVEWLAERGGAPPAAAARPPELVPTRVEASLELAEVLRGASAAVADAFASEIVRGRAVAARSVALRTARARAALDSLAEGLAVGDLGECYRDAEWEGFRQGAAGMPGDAVITDALALRRAADRALDGVLGQRPGLRRSVERTLDRMTVRVAAGYADGVRCRLRSAAE